MLGWPGTVMLRVDPRKVLFRDGDRVLGTHRGQNREGGFQPSSQRVAVTGADRSGGQRMMVAVSSASSARVWRAQARPPAARARALP